MKLLLTGLLCTFLFLLAFNTKAQSHQTVPTTKSDTISRNAANNTPNRNPEEDEFNLFLFAYLIVFCSIVAGAVAVGALAVTLLLLILFGLVSAGIISASILAGLYKRSVATGFKTLLLFICSIGGIIAGAGTFWLINRFLHLHATPLTASLWGALAGLIGGLLCGIVLFRLIRLFAAYFLRKLA